MSDRTELRRLILQIERDVLAQASLRTLLARANAAVVGHRQDLRAVKARINRRSTQPGRFPAVTPRQPPPTPGQGRR